jgi:DNA-binding LacI/PurR family transcriptional regulator
MSVRRIAQLVGVSPATVSRAINNHPTVAPDVRQRVLAAVNRAGYVAPVGKRSTMNIAFLYTGLPSLGSPYDAAVMQGMADRMDDCGFDLMILNSSRAMLPGESFTQMFQRKGIRGAVVRTDARTRHLVETIAEEGFPAVVVGDRFDHLGVSSIHCDSLASSRDAVEHLLSLGHNRIGMCTNRVDDSDHLDRLQGYRQALEDAGIEFDDRLIFREDARLDGGMQLARKINTMRDRPTAIFVADPLSAVGAMNELERLGMKIPQDVSIVGFDDGDIRFMTHPQMTAVVQDAREIGREAFDVLNRIIEHRRTSDVERRILPTRFELHESTAPPAK